MHAVSTVLRLVEGELILGLESSTFSARNEPLDSHQLYTLYSPSEQGALTR